MLRRRVLHDVRRRDVRVATAEVDDGAAAAISRFLPARRDGDGILLAHLRADRANAEQRADHVDLEETGKLLHRCGGDVARILDPDLRLSALARRMPSGNNDNNSRRTGAYAGTVDAVIDPAELGDDLDDHVLHACGAGYVHGKRDGLVFGVRGDAFALFGGGGGGGFIQVCECYARGAFECICQGTVTADAAA